MWRKLKQKIWQWRGVLIAAPSVAGLIIGLRGAGMLQMFELTALDQFFNLRPSEPSEQRIVIVAIDESDIKHVGQWPASDTVIAKLLENIKAQKPKAIGLDMYRDLPVPPGHEKLVKVFETTPNLIGVEKVVADANSSSVAPPPELKQRDRIGSNDLVLDPDGKIRRGLLYLNTPDGNTIFSFGMQLALIYLEAKNVNPQNVEGSKNIRWGKAVFAPFEANDGGYVGAGAGGFQMLLNYRGRSGSFQMISMSDVLENRIPPNLLRDRIVLIGAKGESLKDLFFTPYTSNLMGIPDRMAGVEIHANVISQILSSTLEGRTQIKTWTKPYEWLWIFGWTVVGATLTWTLRGTGAKGKYLLSSTATILLAGVSLIGGSYLAFLGGWWIPVVPPMLALIGSSFAITAYIAKSAGDIRGTFGRYLTDEVVANLLENPEGLKLGGERRKITIFTSDLRGFTATSERLPPEDVVKILNIYLESMADIITQYQGTIDEFMGDGILVLFGAPTARVDDAERAIACGVAMQLAMGAVNEQMKQLGVSPLKMSIGINTGEVVVGNIGSIKRTKYGIVGSQVNLTYRIESYTTEGQIFISHSTLEAAGSSVKIIGEKQVLPKGIKELITIYDVGGIGGKYNRFLSKQEEVFVPIAQEIPMHYAVLDGKDISNTMFMGTLIKLSDKGAEVRSENAVAALTNIKLNLLPTTNQAQVSDDIYAKVLEKQAEAGNFYIYFTSLPPNVEAMLEQLYKSAST